jgi:hypothetical protein
VVCDVGLSAHSTPIWQAQGTTKEPLVTPQPQQLASKHRVSASLRQPNSHPATAEELPSCTGAHS